MENAAEAAISSNHPTRFFERSMGLPEDTLSELFINDSGLLSLLMHVVHSPSLTVDSLVCL